jgi:branched-chain amino acid transport system ATP-binding protein
MSSLLTVQNLTAHYEGVQALWDVSFKIYEKEIVTVIGPNGAGKSTLVKSILGLVPPSGGAIKFYDERIDRLPTYEVAKRGISLIPETRDIFPRMTVRDNLLLGAYCSGSKDSKNTIERVFQIFPILRTKSNKMARTMSGGEQQMLAIGRSLMSDPKLLILDEPSMGLAPMMVEKIIDTIDEINENGVTILLVEQNIQEALEIAHRAYVLEEGKISKTGTGSELIRDPRIKETYLGM